MKVEIGSGISDCIFFLYSVRENTQSTHCFSDWDTSQCFLVVPCHLLPISHQRAISWPLAMAITTDKEIYQVKYGPDLPSQQEVFKAWQAWVTYQALRLCEPAVEWKSVYSGPYFDFLCQLYFCLPVPTLDFWCLSSWTPVIQSSAQKMRYN